jgi:hypothetical protein
MATDSITATGSQGEPVMPANPKSNASIVAAVAAAQQAGISGAVSDAHQLAEQYAAAVGLTLGSATSVTDVVNNSNSYGPYGGPVFAPFGPNQYCGTEERGRVRVVKRHGKLHKVFKTHRVHVCIVPRQVVTTLTVTYSAS